MAEQNLSANLYEHLENSSTFYMLRVGADGRYTYVNKAFAEKFGFLAPDLVGQPFEITLWPDDLEACQQAAFASMAAPDKSIPVRLRKPDGRGGFFWSFYEFSALLNEQDEVAEILCIGYDITESEAAKQELRRNSNKLDVVIENITDAFYILDKNWRFIKVNKVFEDITGFPREYFLGKSIWDVIPAPQVEELAAFYHRAVDENITLRFEQYWPDHNAWLERTIYPSSEGLTVIFKDITEERQDQERIRESNNKLIAVLNSTSDLNILISPEYKALSYNRVAAEFTKTFFNTDIQEGDTLWQYIPPGTEQVFREGINSAFAGESSEHNQLLKFAPGVELWYKLRFYPAHDAEGKLIGVAFSAVNIDKEQRQYQKLEEIARLYSHDIRQPVAAIMDITQSIEEKDLKTENRQLLGYLVKTTRELDRVINRIMKKSGEIT